MVLSFNPREGISIKSTIVSVSPTSECVSNPSPLGSWGGDTLACGGGLMGGANSENRPVIAPAAIEAGYPRYHINLNFQCP
jgi:hypothetical protein